MQIMVRKSILVLILILMIVSLISRYTAQRFKVEARGEKNFDQYADWSVDEVRPGMGLAEAESILQPLVLETAVDYFGVKERLFRKQHEGSYSPGFVVVDERNTAVQVQGLTLQHKGENLPELPFTADDESTFLENHCRATDILSHSHKIQFDNHPVSIRGPVMPQAILGNDPEWRSFCYRTDDLGVCLEGLDHVSSLIPDAKERLRRDATTLEELPQYPKDRGLIHVLNCPLGGTYKLNGPTLTCFSHPDGPISVTRTEKSLRFWHGSPAQ